MLININYLSHQWVSPSGSINTCQVIKEQEGLINCMLIGILISLNALNFSNLSVVM